MKKKLIAVLLASAMVVSTAACGGGDDSSKGDAADGADSADEGNADNGDAADGEDASDAGDAAGDEGSAAGGDLIIAAHNYSSHFGRLDEFQGGEEIIFISADGTVLNYEVIQTENISGKDVEAMEFGSADEWDLTLFTCTLSGQSRVTVRAVIKESE